MYFSFIAGHRLVIHLSFRKSISKCTDLTRHHGKLLIGITTGALLVINLIISVLNNDANAEHNWWIRIEMFGKVFSKRVLLNLFNAPSLCQTILYLYVSEIYRIQLNSIKINANMIG